MVRLSCTRHRIGEPTYQRVFGALTKTLIDSGILIGKVLAICCTHLKARAFKKTNDLICWMNGVFSYKIIYLRAYFLL